MKKSILTLLMAFLLHGLSFAQGFSTDGTDLKDANGNNFVMKGLNVPLAWFATQTNNNIAAIGDVTGANCLRIVVETSTTDNAWQTAVEKCIENNMIPMVELHSVTGSNDTARLHDMAKWWASKASFLTRPDISRYILINIANEWGDWYMASPGNNPPASWWVEAYNRSIQTLRNAGIKTTIVVDAPGYGQDNEANVLTNYAPDVLNADPEKNILFSVHMYCEWAKDGNSDVATDLPAIQNAGVPVIVGEFGFQHATDGSCDIDEQLIMNTSEEHGIGWLAWSWIGNNEEVEYLDMAETWDGSTLTDWGQTVINAENGTETAVTASVFASSDNQSPVISVISPENDSHHPSSDDITIEVSAEDPDGSVSQVELYNGSELLFSATEEPYTFTWSDVADGLYTIIAKVSDDENAVAFSDPVTFRMGEEPAPENQITNNEFDDDMFGWTVENTESADGSGTVVTDAGMSGDNALEVCSSNPGTEDWHIQVLHSVAFEAGKEYEISFLAKADQSRSLGIGIQQNGDPWTTYYNQSVTLNTTSESYSFTFEPDATDEGAQFKFFTGLEDACVYLDQVTFREISEVTGTETFLMNENKVSVYPNPFENKVRVDFDEETSGDIQVRLMNLNGKSVYETKISDKNQEIFLPDTIPSGTYMLMIISPDSKEIVKLNKK